MKRIVLILVAPALAAAGCGTSDSDALETLPTIYTTTSTSTSTTTTIATGERLFYEVKPGDNLAVIAARAGVPPSEIVKLNDLPDNGELLQIGQLLEIPTDVVIVDLSAPVVAPTTAAP